MIENLSPREQEDLSRAESAGEPWALVIARNFVDRGRLVLGWDGARAETEIARAAGLGEGVVRDAIGAAARWCVEHKLHLLGWDETHDGGVRRHFMAVG